MSELAVTYEMKEYHWPLRGTKLKGEHTVETLVDRLNLPESVLASARELILAYKTKSGRESNPSIAAASVVMVSRDLGIPISISDVSKALKGKISPGRIVAAIGEIKSVLGIRAPIPWEGYLNYVVWKLSMSDEFLKAVSNLKTPNHIILERIRVKSRKLLRSKSEKIRELMGRSPVIVSGALVYLAAQSLGLRLVTQKIVSDSIGVSRSSIAKIVGLLR